MRTKGLGRTRPAFVGVALVMLLGIGTLGGAAVTGQAATTQQVVASLTCQPATVQPGRTVGCTLTVTNTGGNNVTKLVVTDKAPGGLFLSSDESRCTGEDTDTLSCDIDKLAAGAIFTERHELRVPSSEESFVQTVDGKFSPKPNSRASDTIRTVTVSTLLDDDANFDGTFADVGGDFVQTGGGISASNPYTTEATVLDGEAFAAGLSVREQNAGANNPNCPNGCFGEQVIQFDITPLGDDADFPESFTLTATIAGQVIPNGTKAGDIVVRHNGRVQPLCPVKDPTLGEEDCIVSKTINPKTKIATIKAQGPGTGNGGWGFG